MNFKFLFPTFRNRYLFIRDRLKQYIPKEQKGQIKALNLGTGEGDYDRMVASYCRELIGCDVNQEDLVHAQHLNADVPNVRYEVNNALELSYAAQSFDLIISCEVIEHVGQPALMVQEMARVLKPGGLALMTFPSREFPITYDPINRIWQQWFRKPEGREYLISQGAYAFGHEYLIGSAEFKKWAENAGFEMLEYQGLSRYLVGLLEVYWTGIVQRIFKKNAQNVTSDTEGGVKIRPASTKEPFLVFITDVLLAIDRLLFSWGSASVGKGVVMRKRG
jgi:ubiquinone/menaquinone biosynthesis C-methylase UbiE